MITFFNKIPPNRPAPKSQCFVWREQCGSGRRRLLLLAAQALAQRAKGREITPLWQRGVPLPAPPSVGTGAGQAGGDFVVHVNPI